MPHVLPPILNRICGAPRNTSGSLWEPLSSVQPKRRSSGLADNRWRSAASMPEVAGKVSIELRVNGKLHACEVEPRQLLVEFIREDLELTGTHIGCDTTYCGACTVLMNGAAVKSCTVFPVQPVGAEIPPVEGLAKDAA